MAIFMALLTLNARFFFFTPFWLNDKQITRSLKAKNKLSVALFF